MLPPPPLLLLLLPRYRRVFPRRHVTPGDAAL